MLRFACTLIASWCVLLVLPSMSWAIAGASLRENGSAVTSVAMPTNTVSGGRTRSPDFTLQITPGSAASAWSGRVSILSSFTGPGGTVASSALAVQGPAQGAAYDTLTTIRTFHDAIAAGTSTTGAVLIRFIPPTGLRAGTYTGTLRFSAVQDTPAQTVSTDVSFSLHILGDVHVTDLLNVTGDVLSTSASMFAMTAFTFPTQTRLGRVRSDTLRLRAEANTPWNMYLSIDGPFVKSTDAGETKPVTSFGWCTGSCSVEHPFSGAGSALLVDGNIAAGSPASSMDFQIYSAKALSTEPGTYSGTFTITIMVD